MSYELRNKKFSHPFMHLLVLALFALVMLVVSALLGNVLGLISSVNTGGQTAFLCWQMLVQVLMFGVPVVLMTSIYYRDKQREFYRFDFGRGKWLLAVAGVVVLLLMVPLTDWLATWNDSWHWSGVWAKVEDSLRQAGERSQQQVETLMTECHPLLNLLGLALVPAVCEELFFRVGIQNLLQRWFKNPHAAIWVTAAVFSLAHGEVFAFMPRFVLGATLGYLYLYGESLLVNVTAHFVNNAIVVVAYGLAAQGDFGYNPSEPLGIDGIVVICSTLAAVGVMVSVFVKRLKISR